MWRGRVVSLYVASAAGEPMQEVAEAHTVLGRGIEGDRYFLGIGYYSRMHGPSYEITLIETETIAALQEEYPALQPGETRRNIVTQGVPLNHLVGHLFRVGDVTLRGIRLCHPCMYLAKLTDPKLLAGLVNRGGLRAQILTDAIIRSNDTIIDLGLAAETPDALPDEIEHES